MLVRSEIQRTTGMSRRQCFALFADGKVQLNGVLCENFTAECQTGDRIQRHDVKGSHVIVVAEDNSQKQSKILLFHKPVGCVVARRDRFSKTIYDLLPAEFRQYFRYVGRLDQDSSGLLLLTDDGDIVHQLTHPRFHIPKTYRVGLNKPLTDDDAQRLLHGERVGMYDADDQHQDMLRVSSIDGVGSTRVSVTLMEGKKRHIRRLFRHVGYQVRTLQRVAMGPLSLGSLDSGSYRWLSDQEIALVREVIHDASQIS